MHRGIRIRTRKHKIRTFGSGSSTELDSKEVRVCRQRRGAVKSSVEEQRKVEAAGRRRLRRKETENMGMRQINEHKEYNLIIGP